MTTRTKIALTQEDIKRLRESNLIEPDEVVFHIGDLVVAENVVTNERRVLDVSTLLLESSKRLLKG